MKKILLVAGLLFASFTVWLLLGQQSSLEEDNPSGIDWPKIAEEGARPTEILNEPRSFRGELSSDRPIVADSRSPLLAATAGEAMDRLVETEPWGAASARYFQAQWLEVCDLEARAARMLPEMRSHLGFDDSMVNELMDFCVGALPASMDVTDSTDRLALRELAEEMMMADNSSMALASEQLENTHRQEGLEPALREAARILATSVDEGAVISALHHLYLHGDLQPPYPDVPVSSQLMYSSYTVMMDVAALLVCRHVGGCRYPHPMVLRRCLQSQYGCYQPYDYWSAVEQTIPPIEFQAVVSFYNQAIAVARQHSD